MYDPNCWGSDYVWIAKSSQGYKWFASEAVPRLLREAGPEGLTLDELNPVFLKNATCPYVAARLENTQVDEGSIRRAYDALAAAHECVLVEGVGGWEVPIGPGRNFSDVAADFKLPVLLVIGNKLGAINHALLTLNAVKARGLE